MESRLKSKRLLVTGGAGFLGSHLIDRLKEMGVKDIFIPRQKDYDLVDMAAVKRLYKKSSPDIVIHLAAEVGGIGANRENPGKFFYDNLMMGVQMIEEGKNLGIEKFVALGTICSYPKFTPVPFREESLWDGYPEETNAPYGLAKKMLLVQSQAYRQQYAFNSIFLLPVNLYGQGDNFSPESSHVIPAIIKKCFDAIERGKDEITVWGSGNATREFLYVEDCAAAIVLATERYDKPEPVNVGTGSEISIKELTSLIAKICGFNGKIVWDAAYPDGQPRRCVDTSRAYEEFGFKAATSLEKGLRRTVEWYKSARRS